MTETVAAPSAGLAAGSLVRMLVKNVAVLALLVGGWFALNTGYLSPDRPTREQWERIERAKSAPGGVVAYQSDFSVETPGVAKQPAGYWGFYNGATVSTVQFDPAGVTVKYGGTPWIGAALHFTRYEPQQIYRITVTSDVTGEPAAIIVRNRQMDLLRRQIPVGSGTHKIEFAAPRGSMDRVTLAFIPDNRGKPQGTLRITSLRIERIEGQGKP